MTPNPHTVTPKPQGTRPVPSPLAPVPGAPSSEWIITTALTAWCRTCGADMEFALPAGAAPADLAAEERGCVWCGEALVVAFGRVADSAEAASVA